MQTRHQVFFTSSQDMSRLKKDSVDLVVTSPPYPMIGMWDEIFAKQNKAIRAVLRKKDGQLAFELMHAELDKVWNEVGRVVRPGGIVCINIGDATRTIHSMFSLYSNHARIITYFLKMGFTNLPNIIWRKPTNAPNKFMGSGMLPAGAYVTLEHEYILIFRKGEKRTFKTSHDKLVRQQSAFFWEERNVWFSDLWDLKGTAQKLNQKASRERSAAFPFEIPYRLINMFSVKGDLVLDPFAGTGTTVTAAIAAGRNSIGYEIDKKLGRLIFQTCRKGSFVQEINGMIGKRLANHLEFVKKRKLEKGEESVRYLNKNHHFPVVTLQERELLMNYVKALTIERDLTIAEYTGDIGQHYS